jgi:NDP-sugar pyrophosphorylase family protein
LHQDLFIRESATIRESLARIHQNGNVNTALVVDEQQRLLNTVTDGDVRRAMLTGLGLENSVSELLKVKTGVGISSPDPLAQQLPPLQAVIMAGGQGSRLHPLTQETPKPMLPIGGRPLLEHIIGQLRSAGILDLNIAIHYQGEKIVEHFGDGQHFGVRVSYIHEEHPLGTGGALSLIGKPSTPLLVINGDILTELDFRSMHAFHQEHGASLTVAVRTYQVQVPYGVIECDGAKVQRLQEKPRIEMFMNAGIYLLEPSVFGYIAPQARMSMPELIQRLMDASETVAAFPVWEYWLDIGQHEGYAQAQADASSGRWNRAHAAQ